MTPQKHNYNWKVFWMTLAAMFTIVMLQSFDIKLPRLQSPLAVKEDIFEYLRPKLESIQNTYALKKPQAFVPKALAAGEYDEAAAYVVVDFESGEIVADKNLSTQLPIASLTKIMTSIVALDLATVDDSFTVTENAAAQIPTKIVVTPGEKMTLEELLHAVLLTSANDATEVVKDGINAKYKEDIFIKAMNEKAKFLGLTNTHFTNPQGFDNKQHYSTVEDLAILSHYAMTHYPDFARIAQKDVLHLSATPTHKAHKLYNWNGLLGVYPGVEGVKIGNTTAAKKTTVVIANREDKRMMVVLLGAPGVLERDLWTAQLLDLGYEQKYNMKPINVTESELRAKYRTWK